MLKRKYMSDPLRHPYSCTMFFYNVPICVHHISYYSIPAVRFGRVPKKEKAKILEQMQKVNSTAKSAVLGAILDNPGQVIRQVIEAHMSISLFTHAKVKVMMERLWQHPEFVNCPAHMVSKQKSTRENFGRGLGVHTSTHSLNYYIGTNQIFVFLII